MGGDANTDRGRREDSEVIINTARNRGVFRSYSVQFAGVTTVCMFFLGLSVLNNCPRGFRQG